MHYEKFPAVKEEEVIQWKKRAVQQHSTSIVFEVLYFPENLSVQSVRQFSRQLFLLHSDRNSTLHQFHTSLYNT